MRPVLAALCLVIATPAVAGSIDTWKGPAPLKVLETHDSPSVPDAAKQGGVLTLHVLLQVHAKNVGGKGQPTDRSDACQERMISTVQDLHHGNGLAAVVAEGILLSGTTSEPRASGAFQSPTTSKAAKWLTQYDDVKVYGFERRDIDEWQRGVLDRQRTAAADIGDLAKSDLPADEKLLKLGAMKHAMYEAQTELTVATMPLRSFLAIQTAATVARQRKESEVAVIIGRKHWADSAYAVDSTERGGKFVALRVLKYDCNEP